MPPPPLVRPPAIPARPAPASNPPSPVPATPAPVDDSFASWKAYAEACRDAAVAQAQRAANAEALLVREREQCAQLLLRFEMLRRQSGRDVPMAFASEALHDVEGSTVGTAFVEWCQGGGPLMSRAFMFERKLREVMPRAAVSVAFAGEEGQLADEGLEGEVWVVQLAAEKAYALPVPRTAQAFGPFGNLFGASDEAAPGRLTHVRPAHVERIPGGYRVTDAGTIA